jgi:hypothetical protein
VGENNAVNSICDRATSTDGSIPSSNLLPANQKNTLPKHAGIKIKDR